jgi:tRNA-dihydrouridine synthase
MTNDGDLPKSVMSKLRTFTGWYTHSLPNGTELRRQIHGLDSPQAFLDAVHAFFDRRAAMAA